MALTLERSFIFFFYFYSSQLQTIASSTRWKTTDISSSKRIIGPWHIRNSTELSIWSLFRNSKLHFKSLNLSSSFTCIPKLSNHTSEFLNYIKCSIQSPKCAKLTWHAIWVPWLQTFAKQASKFCHHSLNVLRPVFLARASCAIAQAPKSKGLPKY